MEDFEEHEGLLDEDPALDYVLYEEMQKEDGSKKPSGNSGCCILLLAGASILGPGLWGVIRLVA
jgi:hypothetical protein